MAFTDLTFWIFILILCVPYWLVRSVKWQNFLLLCASLLFYGLLNPWYLVLLVGGILCDYFLGSAMQQSQEHKKKYLIFSIVINVLVLAFFKFATPFYNTLLFPVLSDLSQSVPSTISILLPVGLSFYTLRKISYMIDLYRNTLQQPATMIEYALYVSFFPQLVSGPIDRAQKMLPQFRQERSWKCEYFLKAWPLIVMGLFKKIFVANNIKNIVDNIYSLQQPSILLLGVGTLGFMIEILADFSAYTDLARGTAYLLGFETTENFNQPYMATSPNDFWNRWHISLSSWLRDYLFFPLRRMLVKRKIKFQWLASVAPALITMLFSGIWHGTGWNFILWGLYWGILTFVYQLLAKRNPEKKEVKFRKYLSWIVMLVLIFISWAIFRAYSVSWLVGVLSIGPLVGESSTITVMLVNILMIFLYSLPWLLKRLIDFLPSRWWIIEVLYYVLVGILIILYTKGNSPDFIYNQF